MKMLPETTLINVADIHIPDEHRKVDPLNAQALAENITENDLLSPIEVLSEGEDGYRLIYGAHRLEAFKLLGRPQIPAIVKEAGAFADDAAIQLRTISENLVRRELSVLDRSVDIATWCEIYRATRTNIKPGKKPKELGATVAPNSRRNELSPTVGLNSLTPEQQDNLSKEFTLGFSEAARLAFTISRASVFYAIKIASIPADLRDKIALLPIANSTRELLILAAEPAYRQEQIIEIILDELRPHIETASEAIAVLDRKTIPLKEERWQKVSASFGQLKPTEQYRFFDLHEDAIAKWQAERGA
jgi:ParB family transcriptional regulator, chromosome partitioning protein